MTDARPNLPSSTKNSVAAGSAMPPPLSTSCSIRNIRMSFGTFDRREMRSLDLCRDLSAWLIQQHANADAQARPDESARQPAPNVARSVKGLPSPMTRCPNGRSPPSPGR